MADRQPMRVQITYSRKGRGTFVVNGMDISHKVTACTVMVIAGKLAEVTFTVQADELAADIETEGEQAQRAGVVV